MSNTTGFIVFSDIHYSKNVSKSFIEDNGLTSWLNNQVKLTHSIFSYAKNNNINIIIHNGDIFEAKNNIPQDLYNEVWDLYREYSKDFRIIFNTGNHDILTLSKKSSLKPFSEIVEVITKPTDIEIGDFYLRVIPYGMVDGNLKLPDTNKQKILLTHDDISGLKYGSSDRMTSTRLKSQIFSDWDTVLNGHIHKSQNIKNIINIGSPMIQDWGEVGEEKRFIICKDGIISNKIITSNPKFLEVSNMSEKIKNTIKKDRYNFYRVNIGAEELSDPIFKYYNVSANLIKSRERKSRIIEASDIKNEIRSYTESQDTKLDKNKLIKIGMELVND